MDSAVYRESFFISVFCIFFFIHSWRSYIISAFLFLHFRFRSFPLHSASVILFCFSNPLCRYFSFLILRIRVLFQFPFASFLFQDLYIFDRHCCIYLYTWINVCFQKFDSFFSFLFLGCHASCSNSFSHPSAVHFRIPLPFIFAFLCRLPSVCRLPLLRVVGRQHSVLAVLSVEHELRLWKKRTLCAFCYSFPSLEWSLWLFYLLLLLSPMTFFRLPIDSLAYRILVSPSWQSFFQYAIMLVYNVLRCILFVSAFERDSG